MSKQRKIVALLLAYNAASTLEKFYKMLPTKLFDEIILFDDASSDNTVKISNKLGILTIRNKNNLGYGGNLKKALNFCLLGGADIIVDIHPDGEYSPASIQRAIRQIESGAELVTGNRFFSYGYIYKRSGMFKWKILPIIALNFITKFLLDTKINDLHQGFRVYTKTLLQKINLAANSNDYIFSFEIIAQAQAAGCNITEVPIETTYTGKKRGASFMSSLSYILQTFKIVFMFLLNRIGIQSKIFKAQG